MTILELVQEICRRRGIVPPVNIFESQDDTYIQIVAYANQTLDDLRLYNWQDVTYQTVFTSIAAESQGDIETLCPNGFRAVVNNTIYDRTRRLPIYGPKNAQEWQLLQALTPTGPLYQYRIRNNQLMIYPNMPAGHEIAFEYYSNRLVVPQTGPNKVWFTEDTDSFALDDNLLVQGINYWWLYSKGMPYAEEKLAYETTKKKFQSTDGAKPTLSLDSSINNIKPGILVPAGSWNLPGA